MIQMLARWRRTAEQDEQGFTLIELMVVILIIAILMAIAIPTYLGARNRAENSAAESNVRNALTSANVLFSKYNDYTSVSQTGLASAEPALSFLGTGATGAAASGYAANTVGWFTGPGSNPPASSFIVLESVSQTGNCYWIYQQANGPTQYGRGSGGTNATCPSVGTAPSGGQSTFP
ncbi:MAG: type II secretion system protein [Acidimicrobiales bacterium]